MMKGKLSIRGLIKALRKSDTGTALVELGVAVPIFTMLLLGSAELARVAYASIEVTNAAKAAVPANTFRASRRVISIGVSSIESMKQSQSNRQYPFPRPATCSRPPRA